jgi:hypothetical protein
MAAATRLKGALAAVRSPDERFVLVALGLAQLVSFELVRELLKTCSIPVRHFHLLILSCLRFDLSESVAKIASFHVVDRGVFESELDVQNLLERPE